MTSTPSAVVLVNPRSRSGARAVVGQLLEPFREEGWDAELWAGEGVGWTRAAAERARDSGATAIFGAGGDGVLAEILPALMNTDVAMGVVPLGTGNVWARELGLSLEPQRAVRQQLSSPPRRLDVGRANDRPFLIAASAGLDARIVHQIESDAGTKALGQLAYPLVGMALAAELRGVQSRVWLDDEPPLDMTLLAAIVTNGRLYGGLVPLVPEASLHDGQLDVALFAGAGALEATAHAARVLTGLHQDDPNILLRQVRRLRIETLDGSLPVQTDGDPRGETPLDITVLPGALLAFGGPKTPAP